MKSQINFAAMRRNFLTLVFTACSVTAFAQTSIWEKTFGGSNDDLFFDVQPTSDGGAVAVGTTESFGGGRNYSL